MGINKLHFIRGVVIVAGFLVLVYLIQLLVDYTVIGYPINKLPDFDLDSARHLNNLLNRNLNQLFGTVLTAVTIAVSLTANMYSFKFLEIFIKDKVNTIVLMLVLTANISNTLAGYALKKDIIPTVQLNLIVFLAAVCFSLVFPYMYYLFRFLHPNTLLRRLHNEFKKATNGSAKRSSSIVKCRHQANESIEHIGNITTRSIERGDRSTAIESISTLSRIVHEYWEDKERMPDKWFDAEASAFVGFSPEALEEVISNRSWVEMKVLSEMRLVSNASIPKMPEVTATIVDAMFQLGLEPAAKTDEVIRETITAHFNTLARLALNRNDTRSLFIIFGGYRRYAESLVEVDPDAVLEIAFYFRYYAQIARELKMLFVVEALAHDLGDLLQAIWKTTPAIRKRLLSEFMRFDAKADPPLPGVKKAQALLGGYFMLLEDREAVDAIRAGFSGLEARFIREIADDLLQVTREKFWEITERGRNIEYVPEDQRNKLREFFELIQ